MIPESMQPWLPFIVALGVLVVAHRVTTRVIFALFFRLTHSRSFCLYTYALLTWPGTVVHEFSHWLMAKLLGVPVGWPELLPSHGGMVFGSVRHAHTDMFRHSLIGVAPLFFGSGVVAALAYNAFSLPVPALEISGVSSLLPLLEAFPTVFEVPYAWVYIYFLFAVANGMMPSPTDRAAWPAVLLFASLSAALLLFLFGVPEVPLTVIEWVLELSAWLSFAFIITAVLDAALLVIIWPVERLFWMLGW
ncbi:MAG: hypothetical protein ACPGWR_29180 [Ardenticatenaceae bacterium]